MSEEWKVPFTQPLFYPNFHGCGWSLSGYIYLCLVVFEVFIPWFLRFPCQSLINEFISIRIFLTSLKNSTIASDIQKCVSIHLLFYLDLHEHNQKCSQKTNKILSYPIANAKICTFGCLKTTEWIWMKLCW